MMIVCLCSQELFNLATYIGSHFAFAGVNAQVSFDFGDYGLGYGRSLGDYGQEDYQLDPTGYYLEQGFGRGMSALSTQQSAFCCNEIFHLQALIRCPD